jgi:DNA-binding LytR/AlgR family response regulator
MRDFASLQTDPWLRRRAAECCLALALGPAFAWISPFTTNEQAFLTRLGYWVGLFACWFVTMAITEKLLDAAGILARLESPARAAAVIGVAALPMILVVGPATHALTGWQASLSEVVELYFQIVLIGSGVALIANAALAPRLGASASAVSRTPASDLRAGAAAAEEAIADRPELPAATSRLVGRLPPSLRGRLVGLEMEDHYVRVHTDRGSALILLRLGDAIAEAAPTPGRQVHRSWWVADDAVEQYERIGRVAQIRLSNGLTAPVSQRYRKELDELFARRDRVPASTALA